MITSQAGYRLVQWEIDGSVEMSQPMPRDQALAAFDQRLHAGGFAPTDRRRLMVVSCDDSGAPTTTRSASRTRSEKGERATRLPWILRLGLAAVTLGMRMR